MTLFRALITIPSTSGIPRDAVVNTWSFDVTGPLINSSANIEAALTAFYDSWGTYRGAGQAWTLATVKWYDLTQPKPRAPQATHGMNFSTAVSTATLPQEVCVCFSFQGPQQSGQKQARRRGRVFLGPLALVAENNTNGLISTGLLSVLVTAGSALKAADTASVNWAWVVISDVGGEASFSSQVVNGWIDNAFDTQRRRGLTATTRSLWS